MKTTFLILFFGFSILSYSQNPHYESWKNLAKDNISLQPEYGNAVKTEQQIKSDNDFIEDILQYYNSKEEASAEMLKLGMNYLYEKGDFVTAMKRFNQAYLLNQNNPGVYYGYGSIFFNLGAFEEAKIYYEKGLKIKPNHSEILTDYATVFLAAYYEDADTENLNKAKIYLEQSLKADSKNSDTMYKLSIVSMNLGDCKNARNYLKSAKKQNNPNITEAFEVELSQKCN
ncbi:MAG: tetratricopeptide repeat protein [Weeksellaceae bacterium]